jgi:cell division initiation protein
MITAKEIREIKFSRSMGGYKTAEVDDFLDRCADAVEELTKINDENERKMQVLAETVVDYRNQEDSIRSALISAQRMSESVISEARKQADDIREAARTEADTMREKAASEITAELQELRRIKQEVADFKARLLATYSEHLTLIGILDGGSSEEDTSAPVETEVAPAEEVVAESVVEKTVPHNLPDFSSLELIES